MVATETVPPPSEADALQRLLQLHNDLCLQMVAGCGSGDSKRNGKTPAQLSELLARFSELIGILDSLQDQYDDRVEVEQLEITAAMASPAEVLPEPEANAANADSSLTDFLTYSRDPEVSDDWMAGWCDEEALTLAIPWLRNAPENAHSTSVDDSLCKVPTMGTEDPAIVMMVVSCYIHLARRFYLILSHAHHALAAGDEATCRLQLSIVPPSAISYLAVNSDTLQIKLAIQTALHVVECAERKLGLVSSSCISNCYRPDTAVSYSSERGICSRSPAAKAVASAVLEMEEAAWKQESSVAQAPRQAVAAMIRDLVDYIDLQSMT
ncbi:hypothetical protein MN608_10768 [Microdochium nivale]|nr:hypothetical protein MN608_10768 [Microdochium nivale]